MKSLKSAKSEKDQIKISVSQISNNAIFVILKNELIYSLKCSNSLKHKAKLKSHTLKYTEAILK